MRWIALLFVCVVLSGCAVTANVRMDTDLLVPNPHPHVSVGLEATHHF